MYGLDGPDALAVDCLGLIAGVAGSVDDFDESRAAAEAVELPFPVDAVGDIAVCGMGGSAIAGDLVLGAYRERLLEPMTVVRDYYLPGWIGEGTLVILSSYSGDTEETLTCAIQALERNALCVAVTSGGKLGRFYAAEGVPVVALPPGLQPRAALLRLLVPVVVLLDRIGRCRRSGSDLEEARETLAASIAALGPDVPEAENPAKQLARALLGGGAADLGRRADGGRRLPLEGPDQRERQAPGLTARAARARPQRDRRLRRHAGRAGRARRGW